MKTVTRKERIRERWRAAVSPRYTLVTVYYHYHLPFSRTKVKGSETRLVSVKLGRKTVAEASLEESNKTPKKTWQCPGKKT